MVDAAWAESVRLTLAVADPDAVLPILHEVTQSEVTPDALGTRIVEVPLA